MVVTPWLYIAQTGALLEVIHSMLRFVSSPLATTATQVRAAAAPRRAGGARGVRSHAPARSYAGPGCDSQVASRIVVLWGVAYMCDDGSCRRAPFFALMVASWTLVELVRYAFYAWKEVVGSEDGVPAALRWLRYSLFLVLYPLGISGEIGTIVYSRDYFLAGGRGPDSVLPMSGELYAMLLLVLLSLYVPGSPYMYLHMWGQRSKKLGGGKPKADKPKRS